MKISESTTMEITYIALDMLSRPDIRQLVQEADVILGVDQSRGGLAILMYGRDLLQLIREGRACELIGPKKAVAAIYDQRTDSLEYLLAAVQHLKGRDEYVCGSEA